MHRRPINQPQYFEYSKYSLTFANIYDNTGATARFLRVQKAILIIYMRHSILFVLILFTFCIVRAENDGINYSINPHYVNDKDFNIPPLKIQGEIIKNDNTLSMPLGVGTEADLAAKSIRAFIGWANKLIGRNFSVNVINIDPPLYPSIPITENSDLTKKYKEKVDSVIKLYPYITINLLQDIDLLGILTSDKIIVAVSSISYIDWGVVILNALIPIAEYEKSNNKRDIEFIRCGLRYDYHIGINPAKFPKNYSNEMICDEVIVELKEALDDKIFTIFESEDLTAGSSLLQILQLFNWHLTDLDLCNLEKVTFNLNSLPASVVKLFDL